LLLQVCVSAGIFIFIASRLVGTDGLAENRLNGILIGNIEDGQFCANRLPVSKGRAARFILVHDTKTGTKCTK
jgi:hypothetical protein